MADRATWKPIDRERYIEKLEILPPICLRPNGFILGEAFDHNEQGEPRYLAFAENHEGFFESLKPMTPPEFLYKIGLMS